MLRRSLETTPRISCEAVPASDEAGAGMSRRLHPWNGAGESFVSFIRLFGSTAPYAGTPPWAAPFLRTSSRS